MHERVAVIGEADIVLPLRALGIKIFSPKSVEEAKKIIKEIEEKKFALCFVQESLFESLREEREALRDKFCPVVVGFSDHRKITDHLARAMKELAVKATGSDSVVKKRGENETR